MASKIINFGLIIVVVGAGLVAGGLYVLPMINSYLNPQPQTPPSSFFSNKTTISLANQTQSPPLIQPATTLMGGNQYASMHFSMDVFNNGSYQYTNMHYTTTVWNFTGSSLADPQNIPIQNETQSNFNTSFNIVPTMNSAIYPNATNADGHIIPAQYSSLTAGDINGHGQDLLIATYSIVVPNKTESKLVILNWNNNTQTFTPWTSNISLGLFYPTALAINLRGYDTEQILVAGFNSLSNNTRITLKLINFSPNGGIVDNGSLLSIKTSILTNIQADPGPLVLEKGDVYGYGSQQFLIYGGAYDGNRFASLYSYNLTTDAISYLSTIEDAQLGRPLLISYLNNGIDQLVAPCLNSCDAHVSNPVYTSIQAGFIYYFDPSNSSLLKIASFPYSGLLGGGAIDGGTYNEIILLQTGVMSFFRYNRAYLLYNYTNSPFTYNPLPIDLNQQTPRQYLINQGSVSLDPTMPVITTDLTFDSIPEIILPNFVNGGANFYLSRQKVGTGYVLNDNSGNNLIDSNFLPTYSSILSLANNSVYYDLSNARTAGDLFGQALRLVHQDTYLTPSNPTIMAVMAAPPTVAGISQDPTNALTAFGQSQSSSSSTETSTSLGFDLTVGIGFKNEETGGLGVSVLLDEESFMAKASFGMSFSHTYGTTHTVDISQTWGVDGQHNGVVFASLLVKHWNYTVVNGPLNGDNLTFSYPLAVTIQKFDTSTFNQLFPQYSVDTGTFGTIQKIGHPETYPAKAQIPTITAGSPFLYESDQKGVSQGTGYDTIQIDASTEYSQQTATDFHTGIGFSLEVATEGFQASVEAQANADFGTSMTVTQGKGTTYYSQVTDINSYSDWQHYQYNYGLFAYVLNRSVSTTNGPAIPISYQVINYWVEPLGPSFGTAAVIIFQNSMPVRAYQNQLVMLFDLFKIKFARFI